MPQASLLILLDAGLRGATVAALALTATLIVRDRPGVPLARAAVVLAAGLVLQVVGAAPAVEAAMPPAWQAPWVGVSTANAVLFWLFVLALFDDEFTARPWHAVVWCAVFAVSVFNCATGWAETSLLGRVAIGLQQATPLAFSALAAIAAAATWRADLIEKRRRIRVFIVVAGSAYMVVMFALRLASPHGRLSEASATFDVAALLVIAAVVAIALLRIAPSDLFDRPASTAERAAVVGPGAGPEPAAGAAAASVAAIADRDDQRLADALQRAMHDERVYREEGLTVGSLARRLGVPEYRLRRHINQRLGFRNFNAFVNSFRLDEARNGLADPKRRELPVLTIALEAGFQSIGPFNRAFKAATGRTPSEFRREHLADS